MRQLSFEDLQAPSPIELLTPDELFDRIDEPLLAKLVEDNRIEYKPNTFKSRELAEYFSMWANTQPYGGLIVLGVRHDKTIEGMLKVGIPHINKVERESRDQCCDAVYRTKRVLINRDNQQDFVMVFRVEYHSTKVVRTASGKSYCRVGDSIHELSDQEIRILQAAKGEVRFETEKANLIYPEDYETGAIDDFIESVKEAKAWEQEHSREDALELMKLGRLDASGEFTPSIACALLFSKDPRRVVPGCMIRFLRFEGETEGGGERWNVVKEIDIDGPLPKQIQGAAIALRSQLREYSRLGPGGKFVSSPEYPEQAWYEAVVNACAHRCYGNGLGSAPIFIRMFDDRLVIESPGPFPPLVNSSNIYTTTSIPTNPYLMDALRYLKYVKAAHEGTRRMKMAMSQSELPPPDFEQSDAGGSVVRVTLRNNAKHRRQWVDSDVAEVIGAALAAQLTQDQIRCVNWMAEHGPMSVTDAIRIMNKKTWHTAKKLLMELVEMKIAEHVHSGAAVDRQAKFRLRKDSSNEKTAVKK